MAGKETGLRLICLPPLHLEDPELALKAQETFDVNAFAAFATRYLPAEMLDQLIVSVEAKAEAERELPHVHS